MKAQKGSLGWSRLAGMVGLVLVVLVTAGLAFASDGGHGGNAGLPQLNPDTMPTQLFWLVVSFLTLYFMLFGVALPRVEEVLQARDGRISFDISKADELRNESNAILAATDRMLDRVKGQAHEILSRTSGEGQASAKILMGRFESELARRTRDAENSIHKAKSLALSELDKTAADLAQEVAGRLAGIEFDRSKVADAVDAARKERN